MLIQTAKSSLAQIKHRKHILHLIRPTSSLTLTIVFAFYINIEYILFLFLIYFAQTLKNKLKTKHDGFEANKQGTYSKCFSNLFRFLYYVIKKGAARLGKRSASKLLSRTCLGRLYTLLSLNLSEYLCSLWDGIGLSIEIL